MAGGVWLNVVVIGFLQMVIGRRDGLSVIDF